MGFFPIDVKFCGFSSQGLHFRTVLPCAASESTFDTGPGSIPSPASPKKGSERQMTCDSRHPRSGHWRIRIGSPVGCTDCGWRLGSVVKSTCCSSRSGFRFQHPQVSSQLLVSPRVCKYQTHTWCTDTHEGKTLMYVR